MNDREELSKREACGIAGVALPVGSDAALPIFYALYALQHRGQESAGIAVCCGTDDEAEDDRSAGAGTGDISLVKDMGFVHDVFDEQRLHELKGNIGIGHVRYPTTGGAKLENAEPLLVNYRHGDIAIAHNGNLVNTDELRNELEREGRIFHSDTDTEVIAQLLAKELMQHDLKVAIRKLMKRVIGSYSLVILLDNMLVAVRDPFGIKPLCLGELRDGSDGAVTGYVVASESPAIDVLDGTLVRDVRPGEVLVFTSPQGLPRAGAQSPKAPNVASYLLCNGLNAAHCIFEYVYFARPDSVIDGRLVYDVRMKIGERLAEEHPIEADIVSPVPDSGIASAIGYAKRSGIDYMEAFIKNRYVGRTFIMPKQNSRDTAVRLKLNVVRANIEGQRIILVDDSIVRGTTSRKIVDYLKREGAKEVHLRIGSPPIIAPCYLGIDTPTRAELVASSRTTDEICTFLHADSLGYLSLEGLIEAVGIDSHSLCLGCLTERYPVEIPGETCRAGQLKLAQF